jgi:hypothetical protein
MAYARLHSISPVYRLASAPLLFPHHLLRGACLRGVGREIFCHRSCFAARTRDTFVDSGCRPMALTPRRTLMAAGLLPYRTGFAPVVPSLVQEKKKLHIAYKIVSLTRAKPRGAARVRRRVYGVRDGVRGATDVRRRCTRVAAPRADAAEANSATYLGSPHHGNSIRSSGGPAVAVGLVNVSSQICCRSALGTKHFLCRTAQRIGRRKLDGRYGSAASACLSLHS